ncbi:MAG: Asp-tRNA(Asn)/Glu-tRNA(Gln) amidotransferase subunit GatC [Ignavibacteriales bacterium]|nr:MAG: Asp-tRNA(Asn)/Glu-tRNA(Gln) amidotransferase subunit GatC [Ignavibacteriales bacterium]
MSVTRKDVEHIAELARLNFTEKELNDFTPQFNEILNYMDKLNELNTDDVEPLSHPIEGYNVFRDDKVEKSISTEEALKNAPDADDQFFRVPKVISVDN